MAEIVGVKVDLRRRDAPKIVVEVYGDQWIQVEEVELDDDEAVALANELLQAVAAREAATDPKLTIRG